MTRLTCGVTSRFGCSFLLVSLNIQTISYDNMFAVYTNILIIHTKLNSLYGLFVKNSGDKYDNIQLNPADVASIGTILT